MSCTICGGTTSRGNIRRCQKCYRIVLAERNRRDSPKRMREKNPMRIPGIREKMTATLHRIGHKPKLQGGNGKPVPYPQRILAEALGWETEYIFPTRVGRGRGYPSHYKLDIANPKLMVCVEVDGYSHSALERKRQDFKKQDFLENHGWKMFRFLNSEVTSDLRRCADIVIGLSRIEK